MMRRLAHSVCQRCYMLTPTPLCQKTYSILHPVTRAGAGGEPYSICTRKLTKTSKSFHTSSTLTSDNSNCSLKILAYADTAFTECAKLLENDMVVIEDFITEAEEQELVNEIQPYFARKRYEYDHWDDAIHGFRETERSTWNANNSPIIERLKQASFSDAAKPTEFVHVLDLEKDGEIKPHKDSVRFCGDTISGISLLSQSVMRLIHVDNKELLLDLLLKPRSLYIMRHAARYEYTHEILHNNKSYFKGEHIEKGRRISIICRNNPS